MQSQVEAVRKWLSNFHLKTSEEIGRNLSMLLGKKIALNQQDWNLFKTEEISSNLSVPLAINTVHIDQDYQGEGILGFPKRDAILVGGFLAMYGDEILQEKLLSMQLGSSDLDAFQEICNQLVSSVDRIAKDLLPKKVHIKQGETTIWEREKDIRLPFQDSHAIAFSYKGKIEGEHQAEFQLILPTSIINQFVEQEIDWAHDFLRNEKETKPTDESNAKNKESANELDIKPMQCLVIRLDRNSDAQFQGILKSSHIKHALVNTICDLTQYVSRSPIKLIVIQMEGREEQGINLCRRVAQILNGKEIPIWLQGRHWNHELVKKARRAGASYLVLAPINPGMLKPKLLVAIEG